MKIKNISIILLLALSLTGCVYDDVPETEEAVGGRTKDAFSVSIALAGMGTEETRSFATRAGNPGEDCEDTNGEFGTADENYIDIDDLYVMTFSIPDGKSVLDADSQLLEVIWDGPRGGKATDTGIYFNGTTAYLNTWLDSKIEDYKPTPGKDFCLVAIANFSQYTKSETGTVPMAKGTKFSDLQAAMNYTFENKTVAQKGIPLFGVKRVNLKNYNKEVHNVANPYLLESNGNPTLWMLRAFAKVEVSLSSKLLEMEESIGTINITSVSVKEHGSTFWVIPELPRMSGFGTIGGTGQINSVPGPTYQSENSETPVSFEVSDDKKSAYLYLPEFPIKSPEADIVINLDMGDLPKEFTFKLKEHPKATASPSNDDCWKSLLRNHVYRFSIGVDFRVISVKPQEWNDTYDNEFNFG